MKNDCPRCHAELKFEGREITCPSCHFIMLDKEGHSQWRSSGRHKKPTKKQIEAMRLRETLAQTSFQFDQSSVPDAEPF